MPRKKTTAGEQDPAQAETAFEALVLQSGQQNYKFWKLLQSGRNNGRYNGVNKFKWFYYMRSLYMICDKGEFVLLIHNFELVFAGFCFYNLHVHFCLLDEEAKKQTEKLNCCFF